MSKLSEWLSNDERRIEFAEERLIVEVAEQIWAAMDTAKVSKAEIATRLGKSKPFITQILNGSRNMTLRSLADVAHCIGFKVHVALRQETAANAWQPLHDAVMVQFDRRFFSPAPINDVDTGNWTSIAPRQEYG